MNNTVPLVLYLQRVSKTICSIPPLTQFRSREISRSPAHLCPPSKSITDRRTDGRTHPFTESWRTKNFSWEILSMSFYRMEIQLQGSSVCPSVCCRSGMLFFSAGRREDGERLMHFAFWLLLMNLTYSTFTVISAAASCKYTLGSK